MPNRGTTLISTLVIVNRRGLHARAAAKFVKTAERFDAKIEVQKGEMCVIGTSIMGLMMLAAAKGNEIHLTISGQQADAALIALTELVEDKFDED